MKLLAIIPLILSSYVLTAQAWIDPWITSQLGEIVWKRAYRGVLADYHPVTLVLASDHNMVAGYLIHQGDDRKHRLVGDWSKTDRFQLQERDDNDRLAGYLSGSITSDQVQMDWMSGDQSRLFDVKAFPENLIKIKSFKPTAEWIEIPGAPAITLSVQKMDYGVVSGLAIRNGIYSRFEGYCLDGTCSIWNTVIQNPQGAPIRIQMRQKDVNTYKATLNGVDYTASIRSGTPMVLRQFDNSMGFLDFVYPKFQSTAYDEWLNRWIEKLWADGVAHLTKINKDGNAGRLVHRSSGWIEIISQDEQYVSGMVTYINPGSTRREVFVWLKKEDAFLSQSELFVAPDDIKKASSMALVSALPQDEPDFRDWLLKVGYTNLIPTIHGVVMATEFNMIYGDDLHLLSMEKSKTLIKKKYWKYFDW